MAYGLPDVAVTGDIIPAVWGNKTRDSLAATAVGIATTAGQIPYATGANALAMLNAVAAGQVLASNGVGVAPVWTGSPTLNGNPTINGDLNVVSTTNNVTSGLIITNTQANGAVLKLIGNGAVTPNKTIRAVSGTLQFLNSAANAGIMSLNDAGDLSQLNSVSVALGAVGTPSYTFVSDANTGMWSPTADTIAWSTAGSERWRLNASGHFIAGTDNAYDIGASGATRPRNLFLAGNATVAGNGDFSGTLRVGVGTDLLNVTSNNVALINGSWNFVSAGHLYPGLTNTYDIGESATPLRVRTIYSVNALNTSHSDYKRNWRTIDPDEAAAAILATDFGRYRYKPTGEDDRAAEWWRVGVRVDKPETHEWFALNDRHDADAQNTASIAAAGAKSALLRIAALTEEVAQLRAELNGRRN